MSAMTETIQDLLRYYRGPRKESPRGISIMCPWHDDKDYFCLIFRDNAFFSCWKCGTKTPQEGFRKIGVPAGVVDRVLKNQRAQISLDALPRLEDLGRGDDATIRSGVESREPWPREWQFRGVPGTALVEMVDLNPSLVRHWSLRHQGKDEYREVEPLPRLALTMHSRVPKKSQEVYLRLASSVEQKVLNSDGLRQKDPDLLPFGLTRYDFECSAFVLVEGPYDLLNFRYLLRLAGIGDVVVCALLGLPHWNAFREKFEKWILPRLHETGAPLVIALDPDRAGQEKTNDIVNENDRRMWLHPHQVRVFNSAPAEDPGALRLEQFQEKWPDVIR